jgi:hypothetical protein
LASLLEPLVREHDALIIFTPALTRMPNRYRFHEIDAATANHGAIVETHMGINDLGAREGTTWVTADGESAVQRVGRFRCL